MAGDLVRLINLVEILKEDLEAAGADLPDDLSDEQLQSMSEAEIKQYYQQCSSSNSSSKAMEGLPQASTYSSQPHPQQLDKKQIQRLQQQFPPQDSTAAFRAWFPAVFSSRSQFPAATQAKAVVICFHSSGNAEDMYTSEGTGSRRVQSALLAACKAHDWLLLAPQLPGRAQRMRDQPLPTLQAVAQELLPLLAPALLAAGGKFGIVAHSLGCWTAYEVMLALRQAGLPDTAVVCFSAMPWPHMPLGDRPWRQQRSLNEAQFKEECRGWDINEAVFSPGMWEMYEPMLRTDFKLFDEYEPSVAHQANDAAPFVSRMRLFWGERDRRVTQDMVKAWAGYASKASDVHISSIPGNHLWPISEPTAKAAWLKEVAEALQDAFL